MGGNNFITREECRAVSDRIEKLFQEKVREIKNEIGQKMDEIKQDFKEFLRSEFREIDKQTQQNKQDIALLKDEIKDIKENLTSREVGRQRNLDRGIKILVGIASAVVIIINIVAQIISHYILK